MLLLFILVLFCLLSSSSSSSSSSLRFACFVDLLTTNYLPNVRSQSLYSVLSHPVASHITSYSIASPDPYIASITQYMAVSSIGPSRFFFFPFFLLSAVIKMSFQQNPLLLLLLFPHRVLQ